MRYLGRAFAGLTALAISLLSPGEPSAQGIVEYCLRDSDRAIVFIHGFWGDPEDTFRNDDTLALWPQLMCSDTTPLSSGAPLSDHNIFSVDWSDAFESDVSLAGVATQVKARLDAEGVFRDFRFISFVAHSAGGLVAKRLLLQLSAAQLDQVTAIIFFATPSLGAPLAEFSTVLRLINFPGHRQMDDLRRAELNTFLEVLEEDWQVLLQRRTGQNLPPKAYCAHETQDTRRVRVVPSLYTRSFCHDRRLPVNADHIEIVKPPDRESQIYTWTRDRIDTATKFARENLSQLPSDPDDRESRLGPCVGLAPEFGGVLKVLLDRTDDRVGILKDEDDQATFLSDLIFEIEEAKQFNWIGRGRDAVEFFPCPSRSIQNLAIYPAREAEEVHKRRVLLEAWTVLLRQPDQRVRQVIVPVLNFRDQIVSPELPVVHGKYSMPYPTSNDGGRDETDYTIYFEPFLTTGGEFDAYVAIALAVRLFHDPNPRYARARENFCVAGQLLTRIDPQGTTKRKTNLADLISYAAEMARLSLERALADPSSSLSAIGPEPFQADPCFGVEVPG